MRTLKTSVGLLVALVLVAGMMPADAQVQSRFQNFVLLVDQSGDMNTTINKESKNFIARDLAQRILRHVPTEAPMQGAIFEYGIMAADNDNKILKVQDWAPFNQKKFLGSVDKMKAQTGPSSLSVALAQVRRDLKNVQGRTAIIVLSGGNFTDVGEPSTEALKIHDKYGKNACIYTVMIGNSKKGGVFLHDLSKKAACGWSVSWETMDDGKETEKYVANVFYGVRHDRDRDGVKNDKDKCPNTPYGATVDSRGCWVITNINFDTGKSDIKPQYYPLLDEIASVMNATPDIKVAIEGHTDSQGDEAYNQKLSESRATAVMNYLTKQDVDPFRLKAYGKGESEPVASNDTAEGRAENRRIEFVVTGGEPREE